MLKNDFERTDFVIFEEIVHNFCRSDDRIRTPNEGMNQRNLKILAVRQTKYALAVRTILGVGVDFRLFTEGDFLSGRPLSMGLTMTLFTEKLLISNKHTHDFMPNLIRKSWTVSNRQLHTHDNHRDAPSGGL